MPLRQAAVAAVFVCGLTTGLGRAAELQSHTLEAFERYIRLTEARIAEEVGRGHPFLWVDAQPEPRRRTLDTQLLNGDVVIERVRTLDQGREIDCQDGMIHHWVATVFVPDVTLPQVLALVQDYDSYERIYRPDVQRSMLLHRDGDRFEVSLRLYKKSLVTVVLNTHNEVRYVRLSDRRAHSSSSATRIAQVEHAGTTEERERPIGKDSGFLWRLESYWRFEERDDGVYLQAEMVGLTRDIPWVFRWLVRPLVSRIPRETLRALLGATRKALLDPRRGELLG